MSNRGFFRSLKKSNKDVVFTGVCGGLGETTQIPAWIWRILFLVSLFIGGFGLLVYILLAIFMPNYYSQ